MAPSLRHMGALSEIQKLLKDDNSIDAARLQGWAGKVGWEKLLNRAGTTFRALPDADKAGIDEAKAIRLMVGQPSMIKRPVLDVDGNLLVGFDSAAYSKAFTA